MGRRPSNLSMPIPTADSTLCCIPARGGSKRLARKNILPLAGKPLLAYSVEAALESHCFDAVYVATDDAEIAEVARTYGAEVPFLMPPELCGDLIPSHKPCMHLADVLAEERGRGFSTLVSLQPTSPLRSADDIRGSVERFAEGDFFTLASVTPIDPHYYHWALEENGDYARLAFGEQYLIERPLLPPVYRPNGSIKIGRLDVLRTQTYFFGDNLGTYHTPEERSVHVATQQDLDLCAFFLEQKASAQ